MLIGDFDYTNNMFFIVFNSLGMTFSKVNEAINILEKCEMSRVAHLTIVKTYLMIAAVSLTGISILLIAYYLTGVDKCLNVLWQYLKRRVFFCFQDVRRALKIRFVKYHNRDNIKVMDFNEETKFVSLSFKHSLKYLTRFTPLFIFAGVFYIIASIVIYENIHKFLIQRPKLLSSVYSRKIMATELFFYTVEAQLQGTEYSLDNIYPFFSGFNEPHIKIQSIVQKIKNSRTIITDSTSLELMSAKVQAYIFEKYPNSSVFLSLGSFPALIYLVQESYFLVYSAEFSMQKLNLLFEKINEYIAAVENITELTNYDSKRIIEEKLNVMIYFTVFACLAILVMYFGYFHPFLCGEIQVVNRITEILMILPNSLETTGFKR